MDDSGGGLRRTNFLPKTQRERERSVSSSSSSSMHHLLTKSFSSSALNLNRIINEQVRNGHLIDARKLFDQNPKSRDTISWNSMIAGYVKSDQIQNAQQLFDEMPNRDVISWNTMLMGFQRMKNNSENVVKYFVQMQRIGLKPTEVTFATVITAISNAGFPSLIPQIHTHVVNLAFNSSVFVASALIGAYAHLGCQIALHQVFDEICRKDVTSWNALISGYMNLGCLAEGRAVFDAMPERNVVSWTTLVNGLIYNKKLDEARVYFDEMPEKNVVSWTVMISGYERNGRFTDALELFVEMTKWGVHANQYTLSSIMSACAGSSSLVFGKQVHLSIMKSGQPVDMILSSSMVDMYSKCGDIEGAIRVFESISKKNLVAWNSMIGGFAGHGLGRRALEEFERMKMDGIRPDQITFVNVLSACARGGLVEEGKRIFMSMNKEYGIEAEKEHFACMVDLYGRAGQLEKAENLIINMPFEPDNVIWGALLGACGLHSNLDLGLFAAEGLYNLEQDHPAVYSLLSKIHGEEGVWSKVTELRKMMKSVGAKKQKAGSWIEESSSLN